VVVLQDRKGELASTALPHQQGDWDSPPASTRPDDFSSNCAQRFPSSTTPTRRTFQRQGGCASACTAKANDTRGLPTSPTTITEGQPWSSSSGGCGFYRHPAFPPPTCCRFLQTSDLRSDRCSDLRSLLWIRRGEVQQPRLASESTPGCTPHTPQHKPKSDVRTGAYN